MTIELWKRNIKHDLFQGHFCMCCVSLDGCNNHSIIQSLSHTVDQIAERDATMDSIVEVVKATPNAKVKVMAYANNVSNTARENEKELIPLSEKRAKVLVQMLIDRGLKPEDVEGIGMGGANPLAEWKDKANWWKNRRFEFMIEW